jgi:hypothetical protein
MWVVNAISSVFTTNQVINYLFLVASFIARAIEVRWFSKRFGLPNKNLIKKTTDGLQSLRCLSKKEKRGIFSSS